MSFLLDPFLAFMLGLIFSVFTKKFNFTSKSTFAICSIVISLATSYSIMLYLKIVPTDFLVLDMFAKILPIEQQYGPRIMFHSNDTGVTKEFFPFLFVVIFYALYFLWFYLGYKSMRNILEPHEPTPSGNQETVTFIRVGGLLVFVSAGMMLFFFTMIPLDEVSIGDSFGAKSALVDQEATLKGYMARHDAKFSTFSDNLCHPEKIAVEAESPQVVTTRDSSFSIVIDEVSKSVTANDIEEMCQARETLGKNIIFLFVNLSTWMFLIGIFMVTTPRIIKNNLWDYENKEKEEAGPF